MDYNNLPKDKFVFAKREGKIADKKLETKPIGSFRDAMRRFRKNKSSVAAAVIILILFLYAFIVPMASHYTIDDRDGYYKMLRPRSKLFSWLGWDGCMKQQESQAGYDYYGSIGFEYGQSAIRSVQGKEIDANTGNPIYQVYVDSYEVVGFTYVDLVKEEYEALKEYQSKTGIQVVYPMPANYKTDFVAVTNGANLWYMLADESDKTSGEARDHDEEGRPIYVANYLKKSNKTYGQYDSIRLNIPGDGDDGQYYVYAVKNQTGYHLRVLYKEYYRYVHGYSADHLFGTNQHGQDIFVCLAYGARLSFLLAICVSVINLFIGVIYGAIEGYYGGVADMIMERITEILDGMPFIVVATLFQMHLSRKVGPVVSLIFAFVLAGWLGIAYRVRTQFYRFKNQEYVLAARTLGASDKRLIFRHILPNSVGTIITGTVLIIPSVIFSESMLTYLGIVNMETSGYTSVGTLLSHGQTYMSTNPHILLFPALFISLLEIAFNLFGNGLRDAFNPSLRGADE
ncbi:MAG: ABC transporter permease [Lachnospiraceae bacterium]|nr:ABC transporter permease [Lachnospiraceae bacterium]